MCEKEEVQKIYIEVEGKEKLLYTMTGTSYGM
jgi:hypothetical protein